MRDGGSGSGSGSGSGFGRATRPKAARPGPRVAAHAEGDARTSSWHAHGPTSLATLPVALWRLSCRAAIVVSPSTEAGRCLASASPPWSATASYPLSFSSSPASTARLALRHNQRPSHSNAPSTCASPDLFSVAAAWMSWGTVCLEPATSWWGGCAFVVPVSPVASAMAGLRTLRPIPYTHYIHGRPPRPCSTPTIPHPIPI